MTSPYLDRPLRSLETFANELRREAERNHRQAGILEREAQRYRLRAADAERQLEAVRAQIEAATPVVVEFPNPAEPIDYLRFGIEV